MENRTIKQELSLKYLQGRRTTCLEEKMIEYQGRQYNVPVIKFKPFIELDWLEHGFSTREGGVSEGIYRSMNLSFSQGDDAEKVMKNHGIMGAYFGKAYDSMIYSHQTHTTNVLKVEEKNAGMGFVKERSFKEVDGFVTNRPGILLITAYADCVPLFFADTRLHVIGLSHSGWRGTVNNMAGVTVDKLKEEYGSKPEDIVAFIGPSICRDCYEVGYDVAEHFYNIYRNTGLVSYDEASQEYILSAKTLEKEKAVTEKKYYLNLHAANRVNLENVGLLPNNIYTTDICTCCNPDILFSHRASKGKRGGLCGYLMIKD